MSKSNPLFVDSTKFRGDMITTQIELKDVLIYEDEILCVALTDHQGVAKRLVMKVLDERSFEARIHLHHLTPITYRFYVEKDGQRSLQSAIKRSHAQYAIIEIWQPLMEGEVETESAEIAPSSQAKPAQSPEVAWARESSIAVRSLIEKWGL